MDERDPQELAGELEQEGEKLESHSSELEDRVKEARQDWQRKRADESVPGALPPRDEDGEGKPPG